MVVAKTCTSKKQQLFKLKWKVQKVQLPWHFQSISSSTFKFKNDPKIEFYFTLENMDNRMYIGIMDANQFKKDKKKFEIVCEISIPSTNIQHSFHFKSHEAFHLKKQLPFCNYQDIQNPELYFDGYLNFEVNGCLITYEKREDLIGPYPQSLCAIEHAKKERTPPTSIKKTIGTVCSRFFDKQKYRIRELKNGLKTRILGLLFRPETFVKNGNMAKLMSNKIEKDVTIVVKNKTIKVHKMVLGLYSSVFQRMFKSTMKESIENKIVITDFTPEVVENAIKYFYDEEIIPFITISEALDLLIFADKYDIDCLKEKMEVFLIKNISIFNVSSISRTANLTRADVLYSKCVSYLTECFENRKYVYDIHLIDNELKNHLLQAATTFISHSY